MVELVVVVAIVHSRLAVSFHLTSTFRSSVACKFEANFSCQTRSPFGVERVLYVCYLLSNRKIPLYQCTHLRHCELVAAVQKKTIRIERMSIRQAFIGLRFLFLAI